ncbi:MAG: HAMP domain-containing histidine kinase [Saprospiraceae bacterium]|nr:HAMP domain-containing histidine kinase [Saprospiraceae bacterium]
MKQSFIWILVALMTISLIGIIVIQSRWINWSINLNEEKFNKEVFSALNYVEKDLVASENTLDLDVLGGDLSNTLPGHSKLEFYYRLGKLDDSTLITEDLSFLSGKSRTRFQQNLSLFESMEVSKLLQSRDLTERIDIKKLSASIRRQLSRRGIDIGYHYGVYSNKTGSFVILDDNFVVAEESTQFTNTQTPFNKSLYTSEYKIDLFETDNNQSPGMLYINFPERKSILFQDLWPTILSSVLFTAIILFCFVYTIHVILRQKKLSEMRTDFINNMTHEFKTPIATINLAADSIINPMIINQPSKVDRFASIIKQENSRMLSQVEKVLQMALLDKKDFDLKLSEINVHEIIIQAVEHANLQVEKKGGQVSAALEASRPQIMADHTHIANIVHNLLDNANKYSPERPEIKVVTSNTPRGIRITVEDKGIGMTKDQRKHIFDKFYRVHTGNLHDVKGFGLGLSYVKAMVGAHKGAIEVQSELGEGSSFILDLPFDGGQEKVENGVS